MKIAFITDSGTGISSKAWKEEGIYSLPLQINDGDENFYDLEDITQEQVYDRLRKGHILSTSLPSLGKTEALFQQLKDEGYDTIFAVAISEGLSGTLGALRMCATSLDLKFEYVDCYVTAVVQAYMVRKAKALYEQGKRVSEIKAVLEKIVHTTNTLVLPDDLQHLKRSGRLTPLAAALGGLLRIKPMLQINEHTEGRVDVLDKVRTMSKAMDKVIEYMKAAGVDELYDITVAHVDDSETALILQNKLKEAFPDAHHRMITLVSVVALHTGAGTQAVQYFKRID